MKQVTATGQTVKQAVELALAQLHTTEDRTEISIIDEGKKGIFGIFGSRPAVVKVSIKVDPIDVAKQFLLDVCEKMGAPITIEVEKDGRQVKYTLFGEKIAFLLVKEGKP